MKTHWTASNIPTQVGRRVLITGGNSGIGFEAALELARHGAEVILPARTTEKANDAVARIKVQVPRAAIYTEILDLADLRSVQAFAARVIEQFPGESLDLLINNAGVTAVPRREVTVDGYERQFARLSRSVRVDGALVWVGEGEGGIADRYHIQQCRQVRQD